MPRRKKLLKNINLQQNLEQQDINTEKNNIILNNSSHINIIKQQDDEYDMAVIMDLIKIQEQSDKLISEQNEKIKQDMLETRNYHIKEILKKIKISNNHYTSVELSIIQILETFMDTENMLITIDNHILYTNIYAYLGLGDSKGTIRLTDVTKDFVRKTILPLI